MSKRSAPAGAVPAAKKAKTGKAEKGEKAFRIQYKTIGLTYSRCPLTREDLLKFLQSLNITLCDYYIVQEKHKPTAEDDPKETVMVHLHCWFEVADKPNIANCHYFDMPNPTDPTKPYHPNIKKAKREYILYLGSKLSPDCFPLNNIYTYTH